jgi:hypothetical protein
MRLLDLRLQINAGGEMTIEPICSGKLSAVLCIGSPPIAGTALRKNLRCRLLSRLFDVEAEGASDTGAIGGIGAQTIGDMTLLDVAARVAHRAGRVLK